MGAWGLLKGFGEGLSFAGQQMAKTQEEMAKEARLEEYRRATMLESRQYQEGQTQKQWAREDERRASDVSTTQKVLRDGRQFAVGLNVAGQPVSETDLGKAPPDYKGRYFKAGDGVVWDSEARDFVSAGVGSGKVQIATFTDPDGNKVPMERGQDGSWKPIVPEGRESSQFNKKQLDGLLAAQKAIDKAGEARELTPEEQRTREALAQEIMKIVLPADGSKDRPFTVNPGDPKDKYQGKYIRDLKGGIRFVPENDKSPPPTGDGKSASQPIAVGTADPRVKNADGSTGYAPSILVKNPDGTVTLAPMVGPKGEPLTEEQAIAQLRASGKHFGQYGDEAAATAAASDLYSGKSKGPAGLLDKKAKPAEKKPSAADAKTPAANISEERAMLEAEKAQKAAAAKDELQKKRQAEKDKAAKSAETTKANQTKAARKKIDRELSTIKSGLANPSKITNTGPRGYSMMTVGKLKSQYAERLVRIIENPNSTPEQVAEAKALFKSTR